MSYANNKVANQPAHSRSLISAFVVHCLDSAMSLVSVTKNSSPLLASVDEQASLSLTWSETPEDTFSKDEAQIDTKLKINKDTNLGFSLPSHMIQYSSQCLPRTTGMGRHKNYIGNTAGTSYKKDSSKCVLS